MTSFVPTFESVKRVAGCAGASDYVMTTAGRQAGWGVARFDLVAVGLMFHGEFAGHGQLPPAPQRTSPTDVPTVGRSAWPVRSRCLDGHQRTGAAARLG